MRNVAFFCLACVFLFVLGCGHEATVDEVVKMVTQAAGGAEKLDAITDQVSTWEFTMYKMPATEMKGMEKEKTEEGKGMTSTMIITAKKPNKLRFDFKGADGNVYMSSCYDGEKAWQTMMGQHMAQSETQAHEFEVMASTWIDGFLHYQDKGFTLKLLPTEVLSGKKYMVLQSTDKYGNVQKYYIDPQTHYIERQAGKMSNMQGQLEDMYMTFSDYKMFDGVAVPQQVAQYDSNDEMVWEAKLTEVKFNTGVQDDVFMEKAMTMK
ncbi:MAG: hypothetical protein D6743_14815 [Calditrichaeota bacterium]|nr:MAG: hypothetical protein D6743_14815 [Calditrichota bacterium]